ncbi:uncharacterized protein PSFLO_05691 [Pseudozyma flocculosa]|uniref:RING-type domain-containing protein n=1 Tax=Pseudozyma flocculosa TaxID=84751 RepID=A0A5C3FA52_9BASI|nr:uncharacterized protein PSFLO_05691 [Pseudozyma flocculosa]
MSSSTEPRGSGSEPFCAHPGAGAGGGLPSRSPSHSDGNHKSGSATASGSPQPPVASTPAFPEAPKSPQQKDPCASASTAASPSSRSRSGRTEEAGPSRSVRCTPPSDLPQRRQRPSVVDLTAPSPPLPRPTVVSGSSASSRSSSANSSRRNTPARIGEPAAALGESARRRLPLGGIALPGGGFVRAPDPDRQRAARLEAAHAARAAWAERAAQPRPPSRPREAAGGAEPIVLEISSDDEEYAPRSATSGSPASASSSPVSLGAARPRADHDDGWTAVPLGRVQGRRRRRPDPLNLLSPTPPPPHASGSAARQAISRAVARAERPVFGATADARTGDYASATDRDRERHRAARATRDGSVSSDESDGVIDLSVSTQATPAQRTITKYRLRNSKLTMPQRSPPRTKPPPIEHPLASTFTCPICLCPPAKASITPCGHVFCGGCLFDALKAQARQREANNAAATVGPQGWGMGLFGAAAMVGGAFGGAGGGGGGEDGGGAAGGDAAAGLGGGRAGGGRGRGRGGQRDPLAGHCPVCRADIKGAFGGIAKGGIVGVRLMVGKPVDDPRMEDGQLKGGGAGGGEEEDKTSSESEIEPVSPQHVAAGTEAPGMAGLGDLGSGSSRASGKRKRVADIQSSLGEGGGEVSVLNTPSKMRKRNDGAVDAAEGDQVDADGEEVI